MDFQVSSCLFIIRIRIVWVIGLTCITYIRIHDSHLFVCLKISLETYKKGIKKTRQGLTTYNFQKLIIFFIFEIQFSFEDLETRILEKPQLSVLTVDNKFFSIIGYRHRVGLEYFNKIQNDKNFCNFINIESMNYILLIEKLKCNINWNENGKQ